MAFFIGFDRGLGSRCIDHCRCVFGPAGGIRFNGVGGIVGGMLKSAYFQGESAAKAAKKILAGAKAADIPVMMHNPSVYMFNYDQLKRFNINTSDLPKGSIIINRPNTQEY